MNKLEVNFSEILPLNRKERFYTGTVLPQIICYDNFKYINRFLNLIPNFPKDVQIFPNASNNNILIQTEYSFKESRIEKHFIKKYEGDFETKDTPDIIILITTPEPILILIEAKMYNATTPKSLIDQMKNQEWIINTLNKGLSIKKENIFHLGLVPHGLINDKNAILPFQLIHWEEIVSTYKDILSDNYFLNVLVVALKKYNDLKSKSGEGFNSYGKNMESKLSGEQIFKLHNEGKSFWVGRNYGLYGDKLRSDKESGKWRTFKYEVNFSAEEKPNNNWFRASDFIKFLSEV
jgi:hypothetical protein